MKLTHQYSLSLWLAKISIIGPIFCSRTLSYLCIIFHKFSGHSKNINAHFITNTHIPSACTYSIQYRKRCDRRLSTVGTIQNRSWILVLLFYILFHSLLHHRYKNSHYIFKKASRVKQIQIWYILSSALLAATAGITTNSIAIILDPSSQYRHLGGPLSIIFPAIVTYVILKHRLFGFIFLVRRALVVASLILTLSGIYFLLNLLLSYWVAETIDPGIAVVTAIVLSVLFYPFLYPRIQQWVPKSFFLRATRLKNVSST